MKRHLIKVIFSSVLLIVFAGCGSGDDREQSSKEQVGQKVKPVVEEQIGNDSLYERIEKKNLDTLITCYGSPKYAVLKNNFLTMQVYDTGSTKYGSHHEKFDMYKIAGVTSNNSEKTLQRVFDPNLEGYRQFTSINDTTLVNLLEYSLVNTKYKLISYPRMYRSGPIYFHLENDSFRINFDYKGLYIIRFLFQLSTTKMLMLFDDHTDPHYRPVFYLGVFDVSKYRKYKIEKQ